MSYTFKKSPNFRAGRACTVSALILHFTANASLNGTVSWFSAKKAEASAHYVAARDGTVVQMVLEQDTAWHAGRGSLEGDPRVNSMSIGIEMVNWGELEKREGQFYCWPGGYTRPYDSAKYGAPVQSAGGRWWAPYTQEQRDAVARLCSELVQRYPEVTRDRIVGHEHVAPGRKTDPGPAFDLEWLRCQVFDGNSDLVGDDFWYSGGTEDDAPEVELAFRQGDRVGELSWIERLRAKWQRWHDN